MEVGAPLGKVTTRRVRFSSNPFEQMERPWARAHCVQPTPTMALCPGEQDMCSVERPYKQVFRLRAPLAPQHPKTSMRAPCIQQSRKETEADVAGGQALREAREAVLACQ